MRREWETSHSSRVDRTRPHARAIRDGGYLQVSLHESFAPAPPSYRAWIKVTWMRLFREDIERVLKAVAIVALVGAIVAPVGWGYEQRHQARTWRQAACTYRLREVARGMSFSVNVDQ